jgi:hypothetical protein
VGFHKTKYSSKSPAAHKPGKRGWTHVPDAGSSGLILGAEEDPRQTNLIDIEDQSNAGGAFSQLIGIERFFHAIRIILRYLNDM